MTLLTAKNFSVSAPLNGAEVPVIRNLTFALSPGTVMALVGESGAGKSMIGRAIAQLMPAGFKTTTGTLSFDGQNLATMPPARRRALLGRDIAFIPQEPLTALNPVLTIGHQMAEHLAHIGVTEARQREARSIAALEAVHLTNAADLLSRYPHQLSGGMCQRVLIAMAFASRPRLVVADEPTTALDVTIQSVIIELMQELQARDDTAVLFITHDLRLARKVCDQVTVLYGGAAVEQGPAAQIFAAPAHPYTRCLQLANPPISGSPRDLYALPDQMPGLRALAQLPGCRFAPRCPLAQPYCCEVDPPLTGPTPENGAHRVACHYPEHTREITVPAAPIHPPTESGPPLLDVTNLSKRYNTGGLWRRATTLALQDISFTLAAGEFLAVVGESGSGKTTLGRLVMGLDAPTSGTIILAGKNVTAANTRDRAHRIRHAQMVFQDPQSALNPRRRVGAIVTQAMEAAGQPGRQARAQELLREMGLAPEIAGRAPSQLSGGQRQRVNIARALCNIPDLLVADEIVSGLDVSVQAQLLILLQRLRRERDFAMLFISHDLSVVRHLCDRVLVMHRGQIVEQGPTRTVFDHPQHPYTKSLLAAVPADV